MRIATRLLLAFAALLACLSLTIYQVRDFRRAAAPFETLIEIPVRAAGGEVGELLGRRGLERLELSGSRVNDKTLLELKPSLEQLPWLHRLSLGRSRVSGPGLAALAKLSQLRSLDLQETPLADEAIAYLKALPQLESLNLTGTQLTDRGVSQLASLENLRVLWLGGTKITDSCIEDLIRHEQLEIICIAHTGVSEAAVRRLEEALGYCTVIR